MIVRSRARWANVTLLTILALSTSCIRRTAISQDFGLSSGKVNRVKQKAPAAPDSSWRAIFQKQTVGAFDPLNDDARVQQLKNRLKVNSQDIAAHLALAGIYESYRLYDDALELYAETVRLARSTLQADATMAEQAALGLGRSARASRRTPEAIPQLEACVKQWPSANSWNELGLLYDESGDLAAGERALREAVTLDEKSDRFHNNFGYNLLLQKKMEAAEAEFRQALNLNPALAAAHNNLGTVLARRGDLKAALEQFQFAVDAATAHNNLAVVLLEAGQYEQSREELVKALTIRHYFGPALANFKLVQDRIRDRGEGAHSK
jgi:Tfp pilus assembly protein PilF